jgi:hypothetical protein
MFQRRSKDRLKRLIRTSPLADPSSLKNSRARGPESARSASGGGPSRATIRASWFLSAVSSSCAPFREKRCRPNMKSHTYINSDNMREETMMTTNHAAKIPDIHGFAPREVQENLWRSIEAGWMSSVYESFPVRASPKSHRTGLLFIPIQRRRGPGRSLLWKTTDSPVIFLGLGASISASSASLRTVSSSMRRRMLRAWRSRVKVNQRTERIIRRGQTCMNDQRCG